MNTVVPIREPELVGQINEWLAARNERDSIMFLLGVYVGRRITDILRLRVRDVKDKDGINIIEKKSGKHCRIEFHPELRRALKSYCKDKPPEEFLIKSRKGQNRPISRSTAHAILKEAAVNFGLIDIGTHSMRKTFAFHIYMNNDKDVGLAMRALNHSSEEETLRYIGVEKEQLNRAIRRLNFSPNQIKTASVRYAHDGQARR